jgi:hypothetical protein
MSYGCKSSDENYLRGCNVSVCCIAAMLTRVDTLRQFFLTHFYKAIRTYLARFLAIHFEKEHTSLAAALL